MDICTQRPPLRGAGDHLDACWLSDEQRLEIRSTATVRGAS
jgi:hypothetical protein